MNRSYRRHIIALLVVLLLVPLFMLPVGQQGYGGSVALGAHTMGYGAQLAALDHVDGPGNNPYNLQAMGFNWFKAQLAWSRVQSNQGGAYFWGDADNIITKAAQTGTNLILRLDTAPGWAAGEGQPVGAAHLSEWASFTGALAAHLKARRPAGKILVYEIWNEPNLQGEWGGTPNPARYAEVMRAAYSAIKANDPSALVITAGLATVGGDTSTCYINGNTAMGDLCFLQQMYGAGINGYHDGIGTHPYGFAYAPEQDPVSANGQAFRRAEQQHALMLAHGDNTPMYATEFGWLLAPPSTCAGIQDWPSRQWQVVNENIQADYLVRAYAYAYNNWSWMAAMVVFNLDFGTDYYQGCPAVGGNSCAVPRYYSLTYRDQPCDPANSQILPRPAWTALKNMAKPGIYTPPPTPTPDNVPPPAPGKPSLGGPSNATHVIISWNAVSDPSGVSYIIEYSLNGGQWQAWQTLSATQAMFTGNPGGKYTFRVRARDGAGNTSQPSPSSDSWTCGSSNHISRRSLPIGTRGAGNLGW